MPRGGSPGAAVSGRQKALYCFGLALATYGLTVLPPYGNGFIAAFVAAIVIGNRHADLRRAFAEHDEEIVEIVKLGIFAVFGSLLTLYGLFARRLGGGRRGGGGAAARAADRDRHRADRHADLGAPARPSWPGSA